MFKAIKKAIWGRHEDVAEVVATHHITERAQITALLVQAFKAHTLFNASFTEDDNLYNTALLGIYDEYGFIVIDEMNPGQGHDQLLKNNEVLLTGRVDGVEMRFKSTLIEPREKNGVYYYKMEIPKQVYFLQRRQDYRVPTRGTHIPFRAQGKYQPPQIMNGYLNDLSRSGLGITINDLVPVHRGDLLPVCKITVPDGTEVIFGMEVCFSWRDTSRGLTRIGGRFKNIDRAALQKVRKTINEMERAIARRSHGS